MEVLLAGVVVIGILIGVVVSIYNGIISRKNSCKRSWSDVVVYSQQKIKIYLKTDQLKVDYPSKNKSNDSNEIYQKELLLIFHHNSSKSLIT